MNQASRGSRVVFVGNIPFELSEEQLIEVFKEVGPVASFRLLFDRDTGRPKGYGFCEFLDAETAASAVRNLNDYEIGGRQLRVDYAAMDDNQGRPSGYNQSRGNHHSQQQQLQQQQPPLLPQATIVSQPLPAITPPQNSLQSSLTPSQVPVNVSSANLSSVDEISKVLASMNSQDLFTLMSQMKQMSFERPDFTKEFLTSNPQVAYALFQAMIMMNIVDPNIITRIMTSAMTPAVPVMPMAQPQPIRQQVNTPPMSQPMPIVPTNPEDDPEHQKAVLMQVLQLTDEQISLLPANTREQIRQLKSQLTMQ
ncbi:uncharacterized protein B0P05DRAFT_605852 [Gilbertella persicaria]|uniref:uncharacterized protein n=1 Tax=Gilbertella persicaria TaxID=101096 RepID=UPI002220E46A|nr:uncharacterized protein B0P05DRAFT_605852 [Gilbertella persicaria]KAI8060373.1 hypothetical protein B0P05DRAFT_605852 [Gilbertella persicaria]